MTYNFIVFSQPMPFSWSPGWYTTQHTRDLYLRPHPASGYLAHSDYLKSFDEPSVILLIVAKTKPEEHLLFAHQQEKL